MNLIVQGTAVEIEGKAILIEGQAGVGKTTLALKLIEQGAHLISDDSVNIFLENKKIYCEVQEKLYGKIELRGLGILEGMPVCQKSELVAVIRLHKNNVERFPKNDKKVEIFGLKVPVFDFFSCETTYLWVLYALRVINRELTLLKDE